MARRFRLPFRIPFFRIFYSTTYTSLFILELLLLAVTPTTLIYSSVDQEAFQYIIIVGAVYVLTALFVLFIYTSRLYTNRTVLAGVGKSWIPIEDGEVSKSVRKLIKGELERSALIALECRPRNLTDDGIDGFGSLHIDQDGDTVGRLVKVDPADPPWGVVQHPGWSSPDPRETTVTPHVFFLQIIDELPNLLEAQVVSLGGTSRSTEYQDGRGHHLLGPRDYLDMLDASEQILIPESAQDFLDRYEHAKFCGRPISEESFIDLTASFSELLSGLQSNNEQTDRPLEVPKKQRISLGHALDTIEDDASAGSEGTDSASLQSRDNSIATLNQVTDTDTATSPIGGALLFCPVFGRTGSIVGPTARQGSSDHRVSRRSSESSLQSSLSIIQQAQDSRRRSGAA